MNTSTLLLCVGVVCAVTCKLVSDINNDRYANGANDRALSIPISSLVRHGCPEKKPLKGRGVYMDLCIEFIVYAYL